MLTDIVTAIFTVSFNDDREGRIGVARATNAHQTIAVSFLPILSFLQIATFSFANVLICTRNNLSVNNLSSIVTIMTKKAIFDLM